MSERRRRNLAVAVMFVLGIALGTGYLMAFHDWNCSGEGTPYKFSSGNITVKWPPVEEINVTRDEQDYKDGFKNGGLEWRDDATPPLSLSVNNANPDCEMFYGNYGNNGWLGLGTIFINGCTITRGEAFLNDFYLSDTFFYSQTNIDHVACQEIGHVWGLDHNRIDTNTCMNDLVLTAGAQINTHDVEELETMY